MNAIVSISNDLKARLATKQDLLASSKGAVDRFRQPSPPNQLVMKVTETRAERTAAFRLVHRSYQAAGLTSDNNAGMRVMKHHLLDTTDVMVAKQYNEVDFTISLVRDGLYGLPCESLFGEEISQMRDAGVQMAEVSCVASSLGSDEDRKKRFETMVKMLSLTAQTARRRGVDCLILAVHPRHAKIYKRLFGCVPQTDVKEYEFVQGNPAVLCTHDFAELDRNPYPLHGEIWGAAYEPWQLDGVRMSQTEKDFFAKAIGEKSEALVPMAS